jgi:hypothetical protein
MISNDNIQDIISGMKQRGHDITVTEIAFVIMTEIFSDKDTAFMSTIGQDKAKSKKFVSASKYMKTDTYRELVDKTHVYIKAVGKKMSSVSQTDITFEDNKQALIDLLEVIRLKTANGEIESKDAIKMETDIRVKLNDKFGTTESDDDSKIIMVPARCDFVCDLLKKECPCFNKESIMKKYNLTEKRDV